LRNAAVVNRDNKTREDNETSAGTFEAAGSNADETVRSGLPVVDVADDWKQTSRSTGRHDR